MQIRLACTKGSEDEHRNRETVGHPVRRLRRRRGRRVACCGGLLRAVLVRGASCEALCAVHCRPGERRPARTLRRSCPNYRPADVLISAATCPWRFAAISHPSKRDCTRCPVGTTWPRPQMSAFRPPGGVIFTRCRESLGEQQRAPSKVDFGRVGEGPELLGRITPSSRSL